MSTWFISDLHLEPARPDSIQTLLAFLAHIEARADALYILGDFFEYWIGDDILETPVGAVFKPIMQALRALRESGVPLYFLHGNRDFLIGETFAERSACELLPEEQVIDLYGTPTLIMHGDSLCTDDVAYQQARQLFRDPQWQAQVLQLSIPERVERAKAMRLESQANNQAKDERIMDVNAQAVVEVMRTHGVQHLIHGHTHRPAVHQFELNGQSAQRVVLGDWYQQASFVRVDEQGLTLLEDFR